MVIIGGPGKCGGSLLMCILTELGIHTGFPKLDNTWIRVKTTKKGQLDLGGNYEWPLRGNKIKLPLPYVVKEPQMCVDIDLRIEKFNKMNINIDHIYILLRRPGPIAPALEFLNRQYKSGKDRDSFERGLSGKDLTVLESAFAKRILQITHFVAELDIPHTLVSYPKYADNYKYAYNKFRFILEKHNISFETYKKTADTCIDKSLVKQAYDTMPEWVRADFRENYIHRRRI